MDKSTQMAVAEQPNSGFDSALEEVLREGARRMLLAAIENEVSEYVDAHAELLDGEGHRLSVHSGS